MSDARGGGESTPWWSRSGRDPWATPEEPAGQDAAGRPLADGQASRHAEDSSGDHAGPGSYGEPRPRAHAGQDGDGGYGEPRPQGEPAHADTQRHPDVHPHADAQRHPDALPHPDHFGRPDQPTQPDRPGPWNQPGQAAQPGPRPADHPGPPPPHQPSMQPQHAPPFYGPPPAHQPHPPGGDGATTGPGWGQAGGYGDQISSGDDRDRLRGSDASPWTDTLGRETPRRNRPRAGLIAVLAALVGLLSGAVGAVAGVTYAERDDAEVLDADASLGGAVKGSAQRPPTSVAGLASRLLPSVVSLEVRGAQGAGTGSGFVIREDGYILTNNHVVAAAAEDGEITVSFSDGKEADARIVGRDASYDLAVVKVDARGLPKVALGDSDAVVVGDPVIAIGSPLGLSGTVTTGIVSSLNRDVTAGGDEGETAFISAIQTDAAINPGNSGGPLVDMRGRVIGVNSAIASLRGSEPGGQSGSIGLGFAIPMKQAKLTAEQLIRTGRATHPVIGVSLDPSYTGDGARVSPGPTQGAPDPVTPGGPADKAGIRAGDVITAIDGKQVEESSELIVAIRAKRPGDTVTLTVERNGKEEKVRVTLGESAG